MNKIITYIILIFIGIVLYLLLNTYERFNIGIPWVHISEMSYLPENYRDLSEYIEPIGDDNLDIHDGYCQKIHNPWKPSSYMAIKRKIGFLIDSDKSTMNDGEPGLNFISVHPPRNPYLDRDDYKPNCINEEDTTDCYERKIDPSSFGNNSEFDIYIYNQKIINRMPRILDDVITGEQHRKFDYKLFMNPPLDPEYKLFEIDNLSLLKIYSMLNKYYKKNEGNRNNIPRPILYISCHAQFLDDPPLTIHNINTFGSENRVLKHHKVLPTNHGGSYNAHLIGCSLQRVSNLDNFDSSNPKDSANIIESFDDRDNQPWGDSFISRYQIPLHYQSLEFENVTENAFLNCNVCYMVILYKNDQDNDYYQYGASTLTSAGTEENWNLNLMRMFGLTTNVVKDDGTPKEVPIMFKSYNFNNYDASGTNIEKFPRYTYYDINTLWTEIITKILAFDDSYNITGETLPSYPLNLFIDACVKHKKEQNIANKCKLKKIVAAEILIDEDVTAEDDNLYPPSLGPDADTGDADTGDADTDGTGTDDTGTDDTGTDGTGTDGTGTGTGTPGIGQHADMEEDTWIAFLELDPYVDAILTPGGKDSAREGGDEDDDEDEDEEKERKRIIMEGLIKKCKLDKRPPSDDDYPPGKRQCGNYIHTGMGSDAVS
jgi:hypothetical protein